MFATAGYNIILMYRKKKPAGFDERLQWSINLLKKAEKLALQYDPDDGFYLAFSAGKDSQALYHIAKLAGVKFQAHMNFTSIDPPEVIRFCREHYPDVITHAPEDSIYNIAVNGKYLLPSRIIRWCCAILKETGGAGTVCLTGVRRQESIRRSKRNSVEVSNSSFSGDLDAFETWRKEKIAKKIQHLNQDQFSEQDEEQIRCIGGKDKIIVNPIIDWSESDVWYFLNEVVKVPHCSLYDRGYKRIGCICCPMANYKQKLIELADYPHVKRNWINAIKRIREQGIAKNILTENYFGNGTEDEICENIFQWWISGKSYDEWYAETFLQQRIDFGEEQQ